MRRIAISNIQPSINPTAPSLIEVPGNRLNIFHGEEWINSSGGRYPFWTFDRSPYTATPSPPYGVGKLIATTFEIVENETYQGRYTVYTKANISDLESSELTLAGNTQIRVNEVMPGASGTALTTGFITNISTYLLDITGESSLVVLEQQNVQSRPIELMGRQASGWGEVVFQNMLRQAQSFADATPPVNPFLGQLWFNTSTGNLMISGSSGWEVTNTAFFGGAPFRYTQAVPSTTWTLNHNFNLAAPFICTFDFYVDVGAGNFKPILPSNVQFVDANTLVATFTNAYSGAAILRA